MKYISLLSAALLSTEVLAHGQHAEMAYESLSHLLAHNWPFMLAGAVFGISIYLLWRKISG